MIVHLDRGFQRRLKNIAEGFAAARFRRSAGDQAVRSDVHVIELNAGITLLEYRQDFLGVDLRQGAVEVDGFFLGGLPVKLLDRLRARRRAKNADEKHSHEYDQHSDFAAHQLTLHSQDIPSAGNRRHHAAVMSVLSAATFGAFSMRSTAATIEPSLSSSRTVLPSR